MNAPLGGETYCGWQVISQSRQGRNNQEPGMEMPGKQDADDGRVPSGTAQSSRTSSFEGVLLQQQIKFLARIHRAMVLSLIVDVSTNIS